jgi:hypothetical protein
MKRVGYLWPQVVSFENLLLAAEKACRSKRFRPRSPASTSTSNPRCGICTKELAAKTYRPGAYRTFLIRRPKVRQISVTPYRDRVVHHALTQVLEPIFERSFVPDSYACRKGKGTHAAADRCQQYARRYRYVLKADIRKFFPSVDHETHVGQSHQAIRLSRKARISVNVASTVGACAS